MTLQRKKSQVNFVRSTKGLIMNKELSIYLIMLSAWLVFFCQKSDKKNSVSSIVWWELLVTFFFCMEKAGVPFNLLNCLFNPKETLLFLEIRTLDSFAYLKSVSWLFVNAVYCRYIYFSLLVASNNMRKLTIFNNKRWRILFFSALIVDWLGYAFIKALGTEGGTEKIIMSLVLIAIQIVLLNVLFNKYDEKLKLERKE